MSFTPAGQEINEHLHNLLSELSKLRNALWARVREDDSYSISHIENCSNAIMELTELELSLVRKFGSSK